MTAGRFLVSPVEETKAGRRKKRRAAEKENRWSAACMPFGFSGGIYRWRILYLRAKSTGQ